MICHAIQYDFFGLDDTHLTPSCHNKYQEKLIPTLEEAIHVLQVLMQPLLKRSADINKMNDF